MTNTIEGTVKWFNTKKGYGFIAVPGEKDVFVHISSLEKSGRTGAQFAAGQGQKVVFTTEQGPKGLQVAEITELDGKPVAPKRRRVRQPKPRTYLRAGDKATGRVKWFNHDKGFGFLEVTSHSDHADIFVHITGVPEELVQYLDEGTWFDFIVGESERGLLANVQDLSQQQALAAE